MIKQHVRELEKELGLEYPIPAGENGSWELAIGDGLKVIISPLESGFSLFTKLGDGSSPVKEALMAKGMSGNLLYQGTGGAALGLINEGKGLALSLDYPYDVPYSEFHNHFEDYLNAVEFWRQEMLKS